MANPSLLIVVIISCSLCITNFIIEGRQTVNLILPKSLIESGHLKRLLENFTNHFNIDNQQIYLNSDDHLSIIEVYSKLVKENRMTFFGSLQGNYQDLIYSLSEHYNIPFITWDSNFHFNQKFPLHNTPRTREKPCRIFSLRQDITEPLFDYLKLYKWYKFAYLYDSDEGFKRMENIGQRLYQLNDYASMKFRKRLYDFKDDSLTLETQESLHGQNKEPESVKSPDIIDFNITRGHINFMNITRTMETLREVDEVLQGRERRLIILDIASSPIGSEYDARNRTAKLFQILVNMGMIREEYHYLLTDFDIHDHNLGPFKESRVNISGFHLIDFDQNPMMRSEKSTKMNILNHIEELALATKLSNHEILFIEETFKLIRDIRLFVERSTETNNSNFSPTFSDLLHSDVGRTKWELGDKLYQYLVRKKFGSEMTNMYQFDSKTCTAQQTYLFLSKFHGEIGARWIATWTAEGKWILVGNERKAEQEKKKFNENEKNDQTKSSIKKVRKKVRIVTYYDAPFASIKQGVNMKNPIGKEQLEGYCLDLAERIFSRLDYDYTVQLVKDEKFGAFINGTWNGMMGELVRGEADVCIGPLTVTSERAQDILFTDQFMTFGLSMMMRKPIKTKPGTFSFLSPLKSDVWLGILSAGIMVSLALKMISLISPVEWSRREDNLKGFSLHNGMWFSMASFVHQGIDLFPLSSGARVIAAIWRFFCLLMMAYYTANLAAALSFEKTISPINSIQDLYEKPELGIKIGMVASGSTREFFKKSTDKIYRGIYERVERNPQWTPSDMDDGYQRVRKSSYALILESKMNEYQNSLEPCNTMMVGGIIGNKNYAIGISKMFPDAEKLRDNITDQILQMREDHTLRRMYEDWWFEKSKCRIYAELPSPKPLALVNISGTFYILISGLMLAMLIGTLIMTYKLKFSHPKMALRANRNPDSKDGTRIEYGFYSTEF